MGEKLSHSTYVADMCKSGNQYHHTQLRDSAYNDHDKVLKTNL